MPAGKVGKGKRRWTAKPLNDPDPSADEHLQSLDVAGSTRNVGKRRRVSADSVHSRLGGKPAEEAAERTPSSVNVFKRLGTSRALEVSPIDPDIHHRRYGHHTPEKGDSREVTRSGGSSEVPDKNVTRHLKQSSRSVKTGVRRQSRNNFVGVSLAASSDAACSAPEREVNAMTQREASYEVLSASLTPGQSRVGEHSRTETIKCSLQSESSRGELAARACFNGDGSSTSPLNTSRTDGAVVGSFPTSETKGAVSGVLETAEILQAPTNIDTRVHVDYENSGGDSSRDSSSDVSSISSAGRNIRTGDIDDLVARSTNAARIVVDSPRSNLFSPTYSSGFVMGTYGDRFGDRRNSASPSRKKAKNESDERFSLVPDDAERQQMRNSLTWEALLSKYPEQFRMFERGLRIIVRSYLDSSNVVKPLPVRAVELELQAAADRWRRCLDVFRRALIRFYSRILL
jgi:hypothetical protein